MWILKIIVIFNKKVFNLNKNLLWRKLRKIKNLQKILKIKNNKSRFHAYLQNKSTTLRIFKNSRTIKLNYNLILPSPSHSTTSSIVTCSVWLLADCDALVLSNEFSLELSVEPPVVTSVEGTSLSRLLDECFTEPSLVLSILRRLFAMRM